MVNVKRMNNECLKKQVQEWYICFVVVADVRDVFILNTDQIRDVIAKSDLEY